MCRRSPEARNYRTEPLEETSSVLSRARLPCLPIVFNHNPAAVVIARRRATPLFVTPQLNKARFSSGRGVALLRKRGGLLKHDQVLILRATNPDWFVFHNLGRIDDIDFRGEFSTDLDFLEDFVLDDVAPNLPSFIPVFCSRCGPLRTGLQFGWGEPVEARVRPTGL